MSRQLCLSLFQLRRIWVILLVLLHDESVYAKQTDTLSLTHSHSPKNIQSYAETADSYSDSYQGKRITLESVTTSQKALIVHFELWDGYKNSKIMQLQPSGSTMSTSTQQLSFLNIRAITQAELNNVSSSANTEIGSVQFLLRRYTDSTNKVIVYKWIENLSPYTLCSSKSCGSLFTSTTTTTDSYVLTAIPYSGQSGTGTKGKSTTTSFTLTKTGSVSTPINSPTKSIPVSIPAPVRAVSYSGYFKTFQLIDSTTNTIIVRLTNKTTVDLKDISSSTDIDFEVEIDVSSLAAVKFSNGNVEASAPYTYCGRDNSSCRSNLRTVGTHTIYIQPIGVGNVRLGSRIAFQYTVIDSSGNGSTVTSLTTNGKWTILQSDAPITARHEACSTMVNGKIYLIGGRNRAPIDIMDISTGSWTAGPAPPIQLHHMQCVVADNSIWIVSAWTKSYPNEENVNATYVLNTNTLQWSTRTALPPNRQRGGAASVLVGRRIYVSHGNRGGHATSTNTNNVQTLGWLDYYDIDTDTWVTNLPTAPNPRDHTGGALVNDGTMICVSGGRNGALVGWPPVGETDCFDLTKGVWTTEASIPVLRSGSSYGTTCDGQLIIAGGEGPGVVFSDVHVFDGKTWTTMPNLIQARHGSGLSIDCSCNSRKLIYLPSGSGGPKAGPLLYSVEAYVVSQEETLC
jgi:hypothetical protein